MRPHTHTYAHMHTHARTHACGHTRAVALRGYCHQYSRAASAFHASAPLWSPLHVGGRGCRGRTVERRNRVQCGARVMERVRMVWAQVAWLAAQASLSASLRSSGLWCPQTSRLGCMFRRCVRAVQVAAVRGGTGGGRGGCACMDRLPVL